MPDDSGLRYSDFDSFMKYVVTQALSGVLGDSAARAIIFHTGLVRFDDPKLIHAALTKLLGKGALGLEQVMMKYVLAQVELPMPSHDEDFVSFVNRAKEAFLKGKEERK